MKNFALFSAILAIGGLTGCQSVPNHPISNFTLSSPDISPNQAFTIKQVANSFGCNGNNQPPKLSWSNAPQGAKSFAISMYDPDAPTGSGFWHWLVVNIPNNQRVFEGKSGVTLSNDTGVADYLGACPPVGQTHRYQITIYALDADKLDIDAKTPNAVARFILNQHIIAKTSINATYAR